MLANLLLVAGQVFTLFLLMGVGFFFARKGVFTPEVLSAMSRLLMYVVAPCIIIKSLTERDCTPDMIGVILRCLAVLVLTYALYALLSTPLYPRLEPDRRDTLRFAVIYGNTSFMGLPLVQGVLGDSALLYCVLAIAVFNVATWTHGAVLMGGKENASPKKAVLNPGVIGCVIGFALFFTGLDLPSPVAAAVSHLGNMNTPLAMVVIGGQMASANLGETFRRKELYGASALKLLALPILTGAVLLPMGLSAEAYSTLVILSACPTAGITGIFAQSFRRDTFTSARMITLSTLLSILTLPVVAVAADAVYRAVFG